MPKQKPACHFSTQQGDDMMITIHNIDETLRFYGSFGAKDDHHTQY